MASTFLESRTGCLWNYDRGDNDFKYYQGHGASQLESAVAGHGERPTKEFLQETYSDRRGNRPNPILMVVISGKKVGLCDSI
jgi:hypothetical protein